MPENNLLTEQSDFTSNSFIKKNQHNRDISGIKKRLATLEEYAGDLDKFAATFALAQEKSKLVDEAICKSVDAHDNHNLKVSALAIAKWVAGITIGAFLGWLVVQAIVIPQYNLKIDELQQELDALKNN